MSRVHIQKIFLPTLALLLAAGIAQAQTPPASPLTAAPGTVAVSYSKPNTAGPTVTVKFTATNSTVFVIDQSTVPFWLTVGSISGPATAGGVNVTFDPSGVAATLNAGGYNGAVHAKVSGFLDLIIPVTLVVSDPASTLTVTDNNGPTSTETIHWTPGTAFPTQTLTMVSSDAPIGFTITTSAIAPAAPANWISVNHTSGIAYTYGAPVTVSFLNDVLYNANVGDSLTGTVTVTPTGGSAIPIAFTIIIDEPPAAITRIFPTKTPVQSGNSIKVVVTGSGFGTGGGYAGHPTAVSLTYGPNPQTTALLSAAGGSVVVASQNTLILTIPVHDGSAVAILSAANTLTISITNGLNAEVAATMTLPVTASPIVYTVTDAGSLVEAAPPSNPTFAPYEIITLWGDNFGPTAGTPVQATTDSFGRYPTSLTTNSHALTVTFYKADGTTLISNAYLLFATNNQINALVPSGVTGNATVQIVVTWNALTSSNYTAAIAAQNPGVFTQTSSGQGQGAILLSDFSVNNGTNKAAAGSTVLIYMTGVGAPNSTALNSASATKAAFPSTCISPASYMATINALGTAPSPLWSTVDGAIVQSAKLTANHFPPCMATANAVTVNIGGKAATVAYAGWVADSVAGLYQINATLASTTPSGTQPVIVTVGGISAQTGVTMVVK